MAAMGCPSRAAGVAVLRALGLREDKCLSLTVTFNPNDLVRVEVTYAPDEEDVEAAAQALSGYMVALKPDA